MHNVHGPYSYSVCNGRLRVEVKFPTHEYRRLPKFYVVAGMYVPVEYSYLMPMCIPAQFLEEFFTVTLGASRGVTTNMVTHDPPSRSTIRLLRKWYWSPSGIHVIDDGSKLLGTAMLASSGRRARLRNFTSRATAVTFFRNSLAHVPAVPQDLLRPQGYASAMVTQRTQTDITMADPSGPAAPSDRVSASGSGLTRETRQEGK